ncbi:uncharacterized protein [Montipora capricornis]|uniref:uncharacterized protein n=1 Tax=Montipora foliosa TaxID=591990 RepID=UPI0035F1D5E8
MPNFFREVLCPLIFATSSRGKLRLINWLQRNRLLKRNVNCGNCRNAMRLIRHPRNGDGYIWRCHRCRRSSSVRVHSYFYGSKISIARQLQFLWKWAHKCSLRMMEIEGTASQKVLVKFARKCRQVAWEALLRHPIPQLGGPGVIVQIDESKFNHKSKFHRGRRPQRERWVLGLFDTQYAPARPYLQLVRRRNAATLLRIIQRKVQPGSIVHTDQWAAYRQLQRRLGLQHGAVNHSLHFVDPVTGVHTQNAESNWCTAKEKFKKMKGNTNPDFLIEYLQEFTWRRWYGEPHPNGCFRRLLDDIAEQYPL